MRNCDPDRFRFCRLTGSRSRPPLHVGVNSRYRRPLTPPPPMRPAKLPVSRSTTACAMTAWMSTRAPASSVRASAWSTRSARRQPCMQATHAISRRPRSNWSQARRYRSSTAPQIRVRRARTIRFSRNAVTTSIPASRRRSARPSRSGWMRTTRNRPTVATAHFTIHVDGSVDVELVKATT